jgi:hypothetical protein
MRLICEHCDEPVSPSDQYAICTDPWGGNATTICENCRDRANDRNMEDLMSNGPGPSLLEQQRAAWRLK